MKVGSVDEHYKYNKNPTLCRGQRGVTGTPVASSTPAHRQDTEPQPPIFMEPLTPTDERSLLAAAQRPPRGCSFSAFLFHYRAG